MKNEEKLLDRLDKDLSWRKKELLFINSLIGEKEENLDVKLRIGLAILYAHWEGYIKKSSNFYVDFIKGEKLKCNEVNINFLALALRGKLNLITSTNKPSVHNKIVNFILESNEKFIKIPTKIKTNSNLNHEVFKEILISLGLDFSRYELKKNLIDIKLVEKRHEITHGNYILIGKEEFLKLHTEILSIIDSFKEQILQAVTNKKYLRIST
ncbi:MAG: hypothetical protein KKC19_01215 [Nanoarchaeota archaeon]|nr:hypothetical protein [Nanoarchaeota archaeon]